MGGNGLTDMSRPAATEPEHEECSEDGCTEQVYPEDPLLLFSMMGTYCTEHMRKHVEWDCPDLPQRKYHSRIQPETQHPRHG